MINTYEVVVKVRAYGRDPEDAMAVVDRHLRPALGSRQAEYDTDGYEITGARRMRGGAQWTS